MVRYYPIINLNGVEEKKFKPLAKFDLAAAVIEEEYMKFIRESKELIKQTDPDGAGEYGKHKIIFKNGNVIDMFVVKEEYLTFDNFKKASTAVIEDCSDGRQKFVVKYRGKYVGEIIRTCECDTALEAKKYFFNYYCKMHNIKAEL